MIVAIVVVMAAVIVGATVTVYYPATMTTSSQSSGLSTTVTSGPSSSASSASSPSQTSSSATSSTSTTGQGSTSTVSGTGTLNLYLADAPPSSTSLKYLLVNASSLVLRYAGNVSATEPHNEFVFSVPAKVGTNVNLTSLQGNSLLLGATKAPAGSITAITFNITGAKAFFTDKTSEQLKVVADGKLMIPFQFQVSKDGTTDLTIDMQPNLVHISRGHVLTPVIHVKSVEKHNTTTVTRTTETSMSTTGESLTTTTSASLASQTASITPVNVIIPAKVGSNQSLNFQPATIKVVIGVNNTIVWTNDDVVPHTVTSLSVPSGAQPFNSGTVRRGDTFQVTLIIAGTYTYGCNFHPSWMKGTIIVLAGP